jgi:AraC-like DNA-binding protein
MARRGLSAKYIDDQRLIQEVEKELFSQPLSSLIANLSHLRGLNRAWELIQTHYSDHDLNLQDAATATGISKNHLNVLLRQATGLTFHQILIRYRVLMAIKMFKNKNINLLMIALENGFASLNTFERDFRNLIGITPKRFRDTLTQDAR